MKVLVIGGGGREDALGRKIEQSPLVSEVFCAPGNAGTIQYADGVYISLDNLDELADWAVEMGIGLTVVGPEEPLTRGIVDVFQGRGLKIFGPTMMATRLEGSKLFTKELLVRAGIPTAKYAAFTDVDPAKEYVKKQPFPLVIKANGLAAGKGVYICQDCESAISAIQEVMVDRKFGLAGEGIIVEEFLDGEEASYIVMVDHNGNVRPLASSQDHKRVGDGDSGLNTGGMGAYSPAPVVTAEIETRVLDKIIRPTIAAMQAKGCPFVGFLYAGLMIDGEGNSKVLEYNVRLGDPETQPILMRMKSDIVPLILMALEGRLDECRIEWDPRPAVCVVLAAKGYPGAYQKGHLITGIEAAEATGAVVYHAGTDFNASDQLVSSGGRVLGVTASGETFAIAQRNAYLAVGKIGSPGLFCRGDIAYRAIERQ